jgi:hypothetical protein
MQLRQPPVAQPSERVGSDASNGYEITNPVIIDGQISVLTAGKIGGILSDFSLNK